MKTGIQEIGKDEALETSVGVVREAFRTVAEDLGLTRERTPTHPSFITAEMLDESRQKG